MSVGAIIVRVLLAALLGRAAWHKLRDRREFTEQLYAYQLLPQALVPAVATALGAMEALTALALLDLGWQLPVFAAMTLLMTYAAAIAINLARGRTHIDCGCGGPLAAKTTIGWGLVARNFGLAALASIGLMPVEWSSLALLDFVTVTGASATALLLYEAIEQAIANQQRAAWTR